MSHPSTPWKEVMSGLIGRRLAVFDDVGHGRAIDMADSRIHEALGWLLYHRLIWLDGKTPIARTIAEAKELWQREGGNRDAAASVTQMHQEFYDAEMRKAAAETAPIPPEIRQKMATDRAAAEAGLPAAATVRPRVHTHQPDLF